MDNFKSNPRRKDNTVTSRSCMRSLIGLMSPLTASWTLSMLGLSKFLAVKPKLKFLLSCDLMMRSTVGTPFSIIFPFPNAVREVTTRKRYEDIFVFFEGIEKTNICVGNQVRSARNTGTGIGRIKT
jgi:hypothetical protein